MWPSHFFLLLLVFLLCSFSRFSQLPALPAHPDAVAIQPFVFPTSTPPTTIPAFPEQSDVAGTCPLHLPDELFRGVSRACPCTAPLSRSLCCPTLAAWLYSAYSGAALAAASKLPRRPSNTSSSTGPPARPSSDMPVLPDDSEACMDGVEKALRSRGLQLAPVNDSCDVAYCYCGVRLRPFSCAGGLAVERDAAGRWVAGGEAAHQIEKDCALPGVAGCNRCLRSLYQIKATAVHGAGDVGNNSSSGRGAKLGRDRDCQLLGLSWLLARNRTLYLPAATRVLRALILTSGGARPISCAVAPDGMPLPVDSAVFDSSSSPLPAPPVLAAVAPPLVALFFLLLSSPSPRM